ncbi:MAG: YggS family pyridoxal phosphate-dependent enzyme [Deltaproteobacteria bacterium]|nr:YggS family pyridoxal phosphate-dependent enzyme [Deltaproteobacteria bacterium]
MITLAERLHQLEERIAGAAKAAGRERRDVTLVAVSKLQPVALVKEAFALGVRDFGENYAQELVEKASGLGEAGARWHFIGRLQKNKINMLKAHVSAWQTADSAEAVAAIAARVLPPPQIFLQVNIGREAQKNGLDPDKVRETVLALEGNSPVLGLMCIPPVGASEPCFEKMRLLADACARETGRAFALSMGMSDDFEQAIAHGATHVRIGTRLFGTRG